MGFGFGTGRQDSLLFFFVLLVIIFGGRSGKGISNLLFFFLLLVTLFPSLGIFDLGAEE